MSVPTYAFNYNYTGAFLIKVCEVCTERMTEPGCFPVIYEDLEAHCRERDDPEHLAMLVMRS